MSPGVSVVVVGAVSSVVVGVVCSVVVVVALCSVVVVPLELVSLSLSAATAVPTTRNVAARAAMRYLVMRCFLSVENLLASNCGRRGSCRGQAIPSGGEGFG
jgi:hypothetical protein